MTFDALNRQLRAARKGRNFLALITIMLLAVVIMQSSALSKATRTTVLVPSRISDGMVANGVRDTRYIEAIALDAVYAFYTVSPETVMYSRSAIERIAAVRRRPDLLEAFDASAEDIRQRKITTAFFPSVIEHDSSGLVVTVHGVLSTWIETKLIGRAERTVELTFAFEASSARLSAIRVLEGQS